MNEDARGKDWIKPETRRFLHRLGLASAILGSLAGLLIVAGWAINSVYERSERQRDDATLLESLAALPQDTVEERIARSEEALAKLVDSITREEEKRRLALLYEELGKKRVAEGKEDEAEAGFKKAMELDPLNPRYPADLGLLFGLAARGGVQRAQQIQLFRESALAWARACELEAEPRFRDAYAQSAADAAVSAAELMTDPASREEARRLLVQVREALPKGVRAHSQIDRMLELLRSSEAPLLPDARRG